MGIVYLAKRLADGAEVALKTVHPAVAVTEKELQRFFREADILRRLQHPRIVAFHEMGFANGLLYFTMDYVPGRSASQLLKQEGPLRIGQAVRIACEVLEALEYAHNEGFVHRDIKPANLLLSGLPSCEACQLADFGLARAYQSSSLSGLTIMGDVGGTIPYMPSEQITRYREAKPPADQYATAATLYRLLTGCYPFNFDDCPNHERLKIVLFDSPVPIRERRADIPSSLAETIHRALRKDVSERFADVMEMASEMAAPATAPSS
ncbi:MAG: serine/threonine protein kinase [Planctomycetaceae bacterium]|nr:serine/threonine protein kinase [Planctomycetaceae bacterium]